MSPNQNVTCVLAEQSATEAAVQSRTTSGVNSKTLGADSHGPRVTIIIGDGRMRASSVGADAPEGGFQGMTFAEALRRNGHAARIARSAGVAIQVEDRGGAISLLDIADAFEELTEQSRMRQWEVAGQPAEPVVCALRQQLIACIAQGRVY